MKFRLPKWLNLSNEQKKIAQLNFKCDYVIPGSPGTGKTVLAIQRIFNYVENSPDHGKILFLVFNRPLCLYLNSAIPNDKTEFHNVEIMTYDAWIYKMYNNYPPLKSPHKSKFDYEWNIIMKDMHDKHQDMYEHVILDEAQDFPEELLKILQIVSCNITAFIDVNQTILHKFTCIESIIDLLCKKAPETLFVNYRNSKNIAEFSKAFWNGNGNFAVPTTKNKITNLPIKVIQSAEKNQINIVKRIINNNLGKNIGIIVDYDKIDNVNEMLKDLEKEGARIQKHGGRTPSTITFDDKPVVHLLTYGTMKGLEYDMVIIPYFDNIKSTGDNKVDSSRMYVAITRARDELIILYESKDKKAGKSPVMSKLLSQFKNKHDMFDWSE